MSSGFRKLRYDGDEVRRHIVEVGLDQDDPRLRRDFVADPHRERVARRVVRSDSVADTAKRHGRSLERRGRGEDRRAGRRDQLSRLIGRLKDGAGPFEHAKACRRG